MPGASPSLDAAAILATRDAGRTLSAASRGMLLLSLCGDAAAQGDPLDLAIGARDAALIGLREAWFGAQLDCLADCAACGDTIEISFDARHIGGAAPAPVAVLDVSTDDGWWHVRVPTTRDLIAIERLGDVATARETLLAQCIVKPADEPSPTAAHAIAEALSAADPHAEILLDVTCPGCGAQAVLPFDIASHLWAEMDRWAEAMLDDVHALARAYGWGEAAILSLSPARRRAYLERAGTGAGQLQ